MRGGELSAGLADVVQQCGEPWRTDVERLAAFDPVELDGPQLVIALLIVSDQPRLTAQRTLDRQVGHGFDQCEVTLIGWGLMIKGTIYFLFPRFGLRMLGVVSMERAWLFVVAGILSVALAVWILLSHW